MIKKLDIGFWMRTSLKEFKKHWPTAFGLSLIYTAIMAVSLHLLVTEVAPDLIKKGGFNFFTFLSYFTLTNDYSIYSFSDADIPFEVWNFFHSIISMVSLYTLKKVVWDILNKKGLHGYLFWMVIKGTAWFAIGMIVWLASMGVMGFLVYQVFVGFGAAGYQSLANVFVVTFLISLCIPFMRGVFYSWALADGADNTLSAIRRSFIVTHGNFWRIVVAFVFLFIMTFIITSVSDAVAFELTSVSQIACMLWRIIGNSFSTTIFLIVYGCLYKQLVENARENKLLE